MDIYNFHGVVYATDGSKAAREWEQAFTDTILKQAGDTGLGEAPEAARPAGPNLRQYV